MRCLLTMLILTISLAACAATPTPRPLRATATERPFPTFGPTRTPKPTRTPHPTETLPPTAATLVPVDSTATTPLPIGQLMSSGKPGGTPSGKIARSAAPALLRSALVKAGVNDPKVYWFTFDEGDHEQALMIQFASPLRWQPGYYEMLRAAQETLGRYYLQIDPPLYTAFVVATDLTGTSDTVQRLRRYAPEKLAQGKIGEEDFLNNYFEPAPVVITCKADGACTGKMATPFPTFNFSFPFPTPTP